MLSVAASDAVPVVTHVYVFCLPDVTQATNLLPATARFWFHLFVNCETSVCVCCVVVADELLICCSWQSSADDVSYLATWWCPCCVLCSGRSGTAGVSLQALVMSHECSSSLLASHTLVGAGGLSATAFLLAVLWCYESIRQHCHVDDANAGDTRSRNLCQ